MLKENELNLSCHVDIDTRRMHVKKVLVIDAGLKPGWSKKTADVVMAKLAASGACECERINMRELQISPCTGCALCLDRGESACRFYGDPASMILEKMMWADGIVTVTPNYALQVPALLKNAYDRLAYVFHRPRMFDKVSLAIVVQGVYGGKKIVQYIDELMSFWGCGTVKGAVVVGGLRQNSTLPQAAIAKNESVISDAANRLLQALQHPRRKQPSFFRLAIFRMTRTSMQYSADTLAADKQYYSDRGWFQSPYYSEIRLDPVRKAFGALIDLMMKRMFAKQSRQSGPA